ncbi:hypothetical protein GCK32_015494, partial [Trichostrongylus colubriformis]
MGRDGMAVRAGTGSEIGRKLSSLGHHAVEDSPTILHFDPDRVVQQECLITTFQNAYFYTRNFEEAQQKLRMFTSNMNRPFIVRYNPYTESIE